MYHGRFKGNHYNAGYNYGSIIKKHGVKLEYCPTFPITKNRIKFGKKCMKVYEKYYPEIIEEIKGLAQGNGADFEFLSTMLLTMYCYSADNKCSCFAFKDKENIIFGRNSDFLVNIEKLYMNVLYNLEGAYAFNGNTTAFIEMEDGINEHGLAIGITFIATNKIKQGLNTGMLTRYILEKCKTVNEAIEFLNNVPIASAQTLTIADKLGNIVVVECNCDKVVVLKPKRGQVLSTNIFVSDEMKKYNLEDFDNWKAEQRYMTIDNALKNNEHNLKLAQDLLSGKYGFMCQYDRKQNADTVWSVVYDLKNMNVYRVEGNPSRKQFKEDIRMKFEK